jgi:hypothetical protein
MQPYLFPYVGYYQLAYHVSEFIFFDDVHFIKKGYINRNSILVDGGARRFTLPVHDASQNRLIKDHAFLDGSREIEDLIERAYRHAPYFSQVFPVVRDVLTDPDRSVVHVTARSIRSVFDYLGLPKHFSLSSEIEKSPSAKGESKIIEICIAKGARQYTNAAGGKELYQAAAFSKCGIELQFIRMKEITYSQLSPAFVPNLSIIDVLMHCSKENVIRLLSEYCVDGFETYPAQGCHPLLVQHST